MVKNGFGQCFQKKWLNYLSLSSHENRLWKQQVCNLKNCAVLSAVWLVVATQKHDHDDSWNRFRKVFFFFCCICHNILKEFSCWPRNLFPFFFLFFFNRITIFSSVCQFLARCQSPAGGFAGGPGQHAHLAPTYAAVNALCILGTEEAYGIIDR